MATTRNQGGLTSRLDSGIFSLSYVVYHLMFTLVISFQIDIHIHIGIVFVFVIGCHGESLNHGINLQTYQFRSFLGAFGNAAQFCRRPHT